MHTHDPAGCEQSGIAAEITFMLTTLASWLAAINGRLRCPPRHAAQLTALQPLQAFGCHAETTTRPRPCCGPGLAQRGTGAR
jgi:hypothetical protein